MKLPVSILRLHLLLAAIALAFVSAGCSPSSSTPVRIGINAWPGYEFLYLAQEKGFYKQEGVAVRLVEFSSLSDARRAYERGQIDGFGTTVIEVLQAREYSTRSPQIVQVIDYSNGADMILARPGTTSMAGLRGKRIGVELGSLGVCVLLRALEKAGMALPDVQAVSMDQASMESAFTKGEIDAVVTYPPTTVKLLRDASAQRVFTTAEIPGEVVDVIAIEAQVCRERSKAVQAVLRAYHRALAYAQTNPADAHAIMARREGISVEEFRETLTDGVKLVSAADQQDYLKPGGRLWRVIAASDRALRHAGQIKGADRTQDAASAAFAAAGDSRN